MTGPPGAGPAEGRFRASEEAGEVSSLLLRPEGARRLLVLGHGAGAGMRHAHLESLARHLAAVGVATFRYQFPFMERRPRAGRAWDPREVTLATVRAAVAAARAAAPGPPLLLGGHSFGGRMASHAVAERPMPDVRGLAFFSFPLHPAGKPGTARADHLRDVPLPMLFLSGTRDALAERGLLEGVCGGLGPRATLHLLAAADHGFRIPKRARPGGEGVYEEAARVAAAWAEAVG